MILLISWGAAGILFAAAWHYGERVEKFFYKIGYWIGQRLL